jgi:hypothetical protein
MAQKEYRAARNDGAAVQPARRRQAEHLRLAAYLGNHAACMFQPRRLFGDPERIGCTRHGAQVKIVRSDPEGFGNAGRVGKAGLAERIAHANPDHRAVTGCTARQTERQTGSGRGIACFGRVDFAECAKRQAAAAGFVKIFRPGPDTARHDFGGCTATRQRYMARAPQDKVLDLSAAIFPRSVRRRRRSGCGNRNRLQGGGQGSLDSGNDPAQVGNSFPRHDARVHGGILS